MPIAEQDLFCSRARIAADRARIDAQNARQRAAEDLRVIHRLAKTPEGRLLMANAIDEAREEEREARRNASEAYRADLPYTA
jgi:hypothetical protein